MNFFNRASLVVTANAFKESKIYSIKHDDGGGDLEVIRSTTATRVNSLGLIETMGANVPRLDYTGSTCPSILVEPQRTNLLIQSNNFSDAGWVKTNVTAVQSSTDFLNGEKAYLLAETTTNQVHYIARNTNVNIGSVNTYSIYFKKGSGTSAPDIIRLRSLWNDAYVNFNILTGVKLYQSASVLSASITPCVNGWFRCTMTYTGLVNNTNSFFIQFVNNTNTSTNNITYAGNVNANVFVAGGQNEVGIKATSYIQTTTATVTHTADAITTKESISKFIGQTSGVIYSNFNITNNDQSNNKTIFSLDNNTGYADYIGARILSNDSLDVIFKVQGSSITFNNMPKLTNGNHKIAIKYGSGVVKIFVNGSLIDVQNWTTPFGGLFYKLFLGKNLFASPYFNDRIKSVIIFNETLADIECVSLTKL